MRARTMLSSSLAYGIVRIKNHVKCITNEVLKSKHDCVYLFACELHLPQHLAKCKLFRKVVLNTLDVTIILE